MLNCHDVPLIMMIAKLFPINRQLGQIVTCRPWDILSLRYY